MTHIFEGVVIVGHPKALQFTGCNHNVNSSAKYTNNNYHSVSWGKN